MATKTISEITINKIRIGGKAPKAIYKGSTEVKKVTKGSTVVYQKENVTYTLTGYGTNIGGSTTTVTFTISSYKGTNTAVAISKSNVSVTAGSGTVSSVTANGTTYTIKVTVAANNTTSGRTHTIKVTQPTSGLSITVSASQGGQSSLVTATITWDEFDLTNECNWGLFSGPPNINNTSNYEIQLNQTAVFAFGGGALSVNNASGGTKVSVAVGSYVYVYYFAPTNHWVYIGSFVHKSTTYSINLP